MADSKQAWDRAGQDLSELGRHVKRRYQERPAGEPPAAAERRKVEQALHQLRDSLDQAFSALGEAIRDPEFGEQSRKAANSVSDALSATFAEVSERLKASSGRKPPPPAAQ